MARLQVYLTDEEMQWVKGREKGFVRQLVQDAMGQIAEPLVTQDDILENVKRVSAAYPDGVNYRDREAEGTTELKVRPAVVPLPSLYCPTCGSYVPEGSPTCVKRTCPWRRA